MATYSIKAPDGNTYQIDGPEGASDEDVRAEVLRQHPTAGGHKAQNFDSVGGQYIPSGSPAAVAARSPVAGNSFGQNALIGSGKMFTDLGLGARQMYAQGADFIDPQSPNLSSLISGQPVSRTAALEQEAANKRAIDAPVMATGGGRFGQISTGLLTALPVAAIPGVNTYAGAAAVGGAYGALNPTTAGESRLLNTGVGAGLGVAGKYGADKLSSWLQGRVSNLAPVEDGLNPARQNAADTGKSLGFRLTPGQQSGSAALQKAEAAMEAKPWLSGPLDKLKAGNQTNLNRIAATAIGETSDTVDASVLSNANERLGAVFDSVRNPDSIVAVDPKATTSVLNGLEDGLNGLLPNGAKLRDNGLVQNLESLASTGSINGEQLGQLSSKLGRAAYKNMTTANGDRDLGQALFAVKDHVDDLLSSTLSGDQLAAYNAARGQYRALMQLTSRVGTTNPSSGDVSGGALANYLQQTDRRGFLFGQNQSDLYNAARFSQAFKPIVGNSGTATRSAGTLSDLALSVPGSIASRLYLTRPGNALARFAVNAPEAVGRGALLGADWAAPRLAMGAPGLAGVSVPYLTQ